MSEMTLPVSIMILSVFTGAMLGAGFAHIAVDEYWKREAVARGAAHYFIGGDGRQQWDWKKPVEAQP